MSDASCSKVCHTMSAGSDTPGACVTVTARCNVGSDRKSGKVELTFFGGSLEKGSTYTFDLTERSLQPIAKLTAFPPGGSLKYLKYEAKLLAMLQKHSMVEKQSKQYLLRQGYDGKVTYDRNAVSPMSELLQYNANGFICVFGSSDDMEALANQSNAAGGKKARADAIKFVWPVEAKELLTDLDRRHFFEHVCWKLAAVASLLTATELSDEVEQLGADKYEEAKSVVQELSTAASTWTDVLESLVSATGAQPTRELDTARTTLLQAAKKCKETAATHQIPINCAVDVISPLLSRGTVEHGVLESLQQKTVPRCYLGSGVFILVGVSKWDDASTCKVEIFGGKRHLGESTEAGALREFVEETRLPESSIRVLCPGVHPSSLPSQGKGRGRDKHAHQSKLKFFWAEKAPAIAASAAAAPAAEASSSRLT